VPYATSIVAPTFSWIVLLSRSGLVDQLLQRVRVIGALVPLLGNKPAVVIGTTSMLLQ
jgi:ABC-type spermidine/putrescine transport system permease subunit I